MRIPSHRHDDYDYDEDEEHLMAMKTMMWVYEEMLLSPMMGCYNEMPM
jgi:hypothetical protein